MGRARGGIPWPGARIVNAFSRRVDVVTRTIAGETIIVPVSSRVADLEAVYTMGEVGRQIWDLIDGRRTTREIADAVAERWGIDFAQAVNDVEEFLGSLEEAGLATRTGAES